MTSHALSRIKEEKTIGRFGLISNVLSSSFVFEISIFRGSASAHMFCYKYSLDPRFVPKGCAFQPFLNFYLVSLIVGLR